MVTNDHRFLCRSHLCSWMCLSAECMPHWSMAWCDHRWQLRQFLASAEAPDGGHMTRHNNTRNTDLNKAVCLAEMHNRTFCAPLASACEEINISFHVNDHHRRIRQSLKIAAGRSSAGIKKTFSESVSLTAKVMDLH